MSDSTFDSAYSARPSAPPKLLRLLASAWTQGLARWRRTAPAAPAPSRQESQIPSDTQLLRQLGAPELTRRVLQALQQQGYELVEQAPGDYSADMLLRQGRAVYVLRCRHATASRVGSAAVREFMTLVKSYEATGGLLICAGRFSREAQRLAHSRRIELLPGPAVLDLLQTLVQEEVDQIHPSTQPWSALPHSLLTEPLLTEPPATAPLMDLDDALPLCPRCGTPMIHRNAQPGSYSGQDFWGCPRHPECKGTRPML